MRSVALLVCASLVLGLAVAGCGGDARRVEIVLYGDSLLYEAKAAAVAAMRPHAAIVAAMPGSAPCDYLRRARSELPEVRPRVVIIETVGAALTPCMGRIEAGTERFDDRYVRDVGRLVRIARRAGARVVIVDPPPVVGAVPMAQSKVGRLDRALRASLRGRAVRFVDGPRNAVTDRGEFAATLPCLASERGLVPCRDGRIAVRDPFFRVHFCPKPYPDTAAILRGCPVYSSGAIRFGRAIGTAAASSLRSSQAAGDKG